MVRRNFDILTDSECCVRLFAVNPVKRRCNKELIRQICRELALVQLKDNLSIGWTKARSSSDTPDALKLAASGRTGRTSNQSLPQAASRRGRAPLSKPR